jgi:cytochrome c oxidase assembly factor CtaG/ferredoxin
MTLIVDAFVKSWPFDPSLLVALFLTAAVYLRGWLALHRRDPSRWHRGQLVATLGGLTAIFLALASPIEPFSYLFLQIHMVQHLLLMMVAPPLLWLGDPLFPLMRGLPTPIRMHWVAPLFRSARLRQCLQRLSHPVTAWLLYVGITWLWHVPRLYELAVRSNGWHYVQHLAFLAAALLFWYPVVRPYPSRPRWSTWLLFPYLILADIQNTVLAALLTFSDRVLYPHYSEMPRLEGLSALDDQATAGVIMWVPGSIVFLLPLFWLALRSLFGTDSRNAHRSASRQNEVGFGRISLPVVSQKPDHVDLLRVPGLGRFLRWRHARLCLQIPLLLLAGVVVYDGLTGPPVAGMNLAGVLPWIHWRGLVVFGLLIAGNVFCMACPFMVPRKLARCLFPQHFTWPRWLRNKWLAVFLLIVFLWAYEAFALWDSPWLTAWIAVGYFVAALVIDSLFQGAAFCKYVCPIGQFNFVQSLVSPFEVKVRNQAVCTSCTTKECIRGAPTIRGCEMQLFLPRKASNMDCTLCLDCVHACPNDNIGIIAGPPAAALWHDPLRSGVGRFGKRADLAALVLILVFGGFANAAGMVGPVAEWQDWLQLRWGLATPFWAITAYYLFALIVLPVIMVACAGWLSHWWSSLSTSWFAVATRYVFALIPLGFAMWLSHYSFHLLTSYEAAVPSAQRFAINLGIDLGTPDWVCACCRPVMDWLPRLEILFLDVGLLLSLYTAYRINLSTALDLPHALKALAPWAILLLLLFAAGVWIVLQPMQMRGTLQLAG